MATPYDILGVAMSASPQTIRRAYRQQVQRLHPDRVGATAQTHAAFLAVQEAYRLLSDPVRRAALDAALRAPPAAAPPRAPSPPMAVGPVRRGDTLELTVSVPLADLLQGVVLTLRAKTTQTCPICQGRPRPCLRCGGSGQVWRPRAWQIQVPAGTPDGAHLRLTGVGHEGPWFTHPGDVLVQIKWSGNKGWRWRRHRLENAWTLPWQCQTHGGIRRFKDIAGVAKHALIPPGIPEGGWLQVNGVGFPQASGARGPVWVRIHYLGYWWRSRWARFRLSTRRQRMDD